MLRNTTFVMAASCTFQSIVLAVAMPLVDPCTVHVIPLAPSLKTLMMTVSELGTVRENVHTFIVFTSYNLALMLNTCRDRDVEVSNVSVENDRVTPAVGDNVLKYSDNSCKRQQAINIVIEASSTSKCDCRTFALRY
jgi:hypothetical protein